MASVGESSLSEERINASQQSKRVGESKSISMMTCGQYETRTTDFMNRLECITSTHLDSTKMGKSALNL